ncbi:UMP-CMP kinase 2, mitochondrial isoform X2 [Xenopus laevis]|uniref:UMP-CMP kinase 2, mitochondrial n=1 Tax=Xenopus laevis TaxID=8355 RepID=A0A8J0VGC1_XENLA|nr:UMP-CMP kinase 2, mitochondrial isoform X2 [Xenopus laevis]
MILGWSTVGLLSRLITKREAVRRQIEIISSACSYCISSSYSQIMGTSHNPCSTDWEHRIFAVDANPSLGYPEPFYFTSLTNKDRASPATSNEWPMLAHGGIALSVCITDPFPVSAARLHRSLGQQLAQLFSGTCHVLRLLSYLPQDPYASLLRGFFICDPQNCTSTQHRLKHLLSEHRQHISSFTYQQKPQGGIWQNVLELNGGEQEMEEHWQVVRMGEPDPSPFALNILHTAVYYSLSSTRAVLLQCSACIPEAARILELLDKCDTSAKKGRFPVIVIEGLDATGKSTLTESLKDSLKATLLRSPPDCISKWRKTFDDEPSLIKRAYYAAGNYVGACEIAKASMNSPVIVDRYWHSTAAYAIATEIVGSVHSLPPCHHEVYQWPRDLLRPDLVILLTVSDEERMRRMRGRGLEETKEEKELESNTMFRLKVEEAYKRIENPQCVIIDASPAKEMVLKETLNVVRKHCVI